MDAAISDLQGNKNFNITDNLTCPDGLSFITATFQNSNDNSNDEDGICDSDHDYDNDDDDNNGDYDSDDDKKQVVFNAMTT